MKWTGRNILITMILLALPLRSYAAERIISFSAGVDAEEIGDLDTLTLYVTVETENVKRIPIPELPDLKSFIILNESTSRQERFSIVNGKRTHTKTVTFAYRLKPEAQGTFTIDPVVIRYAGSQYKTDPITVTVVAGHRKSGGKSYSFEEGPRVDLNKLKNDIFILVEPEESRLYEGEQLFLTYTLYSRLDIDSVSLKQNPNFPGFYIEDIFNAARLDKKKESYENRIFTTSLIKKVALFPLKPGRFSPDPLVLETTVIVTSDDLLDIFGRPYTLNLKSNEVKIDVLPLPKLTEETSFSGIVGDLEVGISTPISTVSTGNSITCYLTLKSTGNLNVITDPGLALSKQGRIYLSDTMLNTLEGENSVHFIKKFEYTIIPEESGKLTVSSPDFIYFDTENRGYVSAEAEAVVLTVTGEDIVREKPLRAEKRSFQSGSLSFIKEDVKSLKSLSISPLHNSSYYIYHTILIALAGVFLFMRVKKEKLQKNEGLLKMRRARSTALQLLEHAGAQMEEKLYGEAVQSIHRAIITYLADKMTCNVQDITAKNIHQILENFPGMNEKAKGDFLSIFKTCMMMKFSSHQMNNERVVQDLRKKSMEVINSMEKLSGRR